MQFLIDCLISLIDFTRNEILVRDGKGAKDRITMLPESLKARFKAILKRSRRSMSGTWPGLKMAGIRVGMDGPGAGHR